MSSGARNLTASPGLAVLSGTSLATSVAVHLLGTGAGILSTRWLGPQGKGLLVTVMLWPGLLAAVGGGLGLEDAVVYFVATLPERRGSILATGTALAGVQAALLTVAGWFLLPALLGHDGAGAVLDGRLYLGWIVLSYLTLTAMACLRGELAFKAFNLSRLTVVAGMLLGLVALASANAVSVRNVTLVYLAANLASLLAAWAAVLARSGPSARPDPGLALPLLRYTLKSHLGNVIALANERADMAVIALLLASYQVGLYAAALSLAAVVRLFGSSFAIVALPSLASQRHGPGRPMADVSRLVRATLYLSLLAALALLVLAPALIRVLLGPAFLPAAPVARLLGLAAVALNASRVIGGGLKAANLALTSSMAEMLAGAATVAALLALLPWLGIMGAAIASLLSYTTSLAYLTCAARRHLNISIRALLLPSRADLAWLTSGFARLAGRPAPSTV